MVECAGLENRSAQSSSSDPTDSYKSDRKNLACFLALLAQKWPDLAALVMAWPDLPVALRLGISAMVNAARQQNKVDAEEPLEGRD